MPTIKYTSGQIVGQHGCRYIQEGRSIARVNGKNRPYMERHAFFECGNCGRRFEAHIGKVKSGWTKSCGCIKLTSDGISMLPNGERDPLHIVWNRMISRCTNPKDVGFKNYGARGISVCDEWVNSFSVFRAWAINAGWKPKLQIDRIDNNGNYCPQNCRFVTNRENSKNKRNNKFCWLNGEKLIFSDAAERLGVNRMTIAAWSKQSIESKKFRKRPIGLSFKEPVNV